MPHFIDDAWTDQERDWFENLALQSGFDVTARKWPFGDRTLVYYRRTQDGPLYQVMAIDHPSLDPPDVREVASAMARAWTQFPAVARYVEGSNYAWNLRDLLAEWREVD